MDDALRRLHDVFGGLTTGTDPNMCESPENRSGMLTVVAVGLRIFYAFAGNSTNIREI